MICNKLIECYNAAINNKHVSNCCNPNAKCLQSSDKSLHIKCEEHKRKYILDNPNKLLVTKYKIDDGVIVVDKANTHGQKKCDFMLCIEKQGMDVVILIELKGKNVRKALEQLKDTYDLYQSFYNKFKVVLCRVVPTSSLPKIQAEPAYVKLNTALKRHNGSKIKNHIIIQEKQLQEQVI